MLYSHPFSLGKCSKVGDDDFEYKHFFVAELLKTNLGCKMENIQEEEFVYNLIFDKHYEINVGGLRFLSHHPNHNNGNIRLEEGEEFDKEQRSKKVYVDENGAYFNSYSLKHVTSSKHPDVSVKEFLADLLKF